MQPFIITSIVVLFAAAGFNFYLLVLAHRGFEQLDSIIARTGSDLRWDMGELSRQVERHSNRLNAHSDRTDRLGDRLAALGEHIADLDTPIDHEAFMEGTAAIEANDAPVEDDGFITVHSPFYGATRVCVAPVEPPGGNQTAAQGAAIQQAWAVAQQNATLIQPSPYRYQQDTQMQSPSYAAERAGATVAKRLLCTAQFGAGQPCVTNASERPMMWGQL